MKPVERMITGGAVWALPDSALEVMWIGPGGGLHIGTPRRPGGITTPIRHPSADGTYNTLKEAQKALDAFIAAAEEKP